MEHWPSVVLPRNHSKQHKWRLVVHHSDLQTHRARHSNTPVFPALRRTRDSGPAWAAWVTLLSEQTPGCYVPGDNTCHTGADKGAVPLPRVWTPAVGKMRWACSHFRLSRVHHCATLPTSPQKFFSGQVSTAKEKSTHFLSILEPGAHSQHLLFCETEHSAGMCVCVCVGSVSLPQLA